jgi:death-on-curing protein
VSDWTWLSAEVLIAIHEEQLSEHGGAAGIRDVGLFESVLARPRNLVAYGHPDAADLAASYAFGLCRNHPFVDGNKRTAYVSARLFLELNGFALEATQSDKAMIMLALAAGTVSEAEFAAWLRAHSVRRKV